jgi:hypothetical protein
LASILCGSAPGDAPGPSRFHSPAEYGFFRLWTDLGFGSFELRYLRDKQKREVDFLVVRDRKPWFLVEVKSADQALSPALAHFQLQIKAPHAFQMVMDLPFEPADCFKTHRPTIVPARTLLSHCRKRPIIEPRCVSQCGSRSMD